MSKPFRISILSADKRIFEGEIVALTAPAAGGYVGIWADHCPLLALLVPGNLTFREPAGTLHRVTVAGEGLLEVRENVATVLLHENFA
ncbi:MAG: F0F1 ATP synthase subunit epsilon [Candidatus Omnitrophica bacterium]|nr:F0F1 ATP synthase subunit epsilon [Candidatus Omnitrophota bacterium]